MYFSALTYYIVQCIGFRSVVGIIFLDEIDKLRKTFSSQSDRDVGGEGVQQRLLKVLEGTAVRIPDKRGMPSSYKTIDTTNILFVGSGAFTGLEKIIRNRTNKKVRILLLIFINSIVFLQLWYFYRCFPSY